MALASVGGAGRPTARRRDQAIGAIGIGRGRAEGKGVAYNLFPALGDALPRLLEEIVVETTEAVGDKAQAKAPVLKHRRPGDPEPGALKASKRTRYSRRRSTGGIITGRVDFKAKDPTKADRTHQYAFPVEVGTVFTAAQPFLVPALVEERPRFRARLQSLEARARRAVGA